LFIFNLTLTLIGSGFYIFFRYSLFSSKPFSGANETAAFQLREAAVSMEKEMRKA